MCRHDAIVHPALKAILRAAQQPCHIPWLLRQLPGQHKACGASESAQGGTITSCTGYCYLWRSREKRLQDRRVLHSKLSTYLGFAM